MNNFLEKVFEKVSFCRHFEQYVYKKVQDKTQLKEVYRIDRQSDIGWESFLKLGKPTLFFKLGNF